MNEQILVDRLKRRMIDLGRRLGRLHTPMDTLLLTIAATGQLPNRFDALEVFGMHGLWHTKDYADRCDSLEAFEINPVFVREFSHQFPFATVHAEDAISAIRGGRLARQEYNWIVIDNPVRAPFGENYFEHFDVIEDAINLLHDGWIIFNFIFNFADGCLPEHRERRSLFYGKPNPSLKQADEVYRNVFEEQGMLISDCIFISRNPTCGYLAYRADKSRELR